MSKQPCQVCMVWLCADCPQDAVEDCSAALSLQPDYVKALVRRSAAHEKLENLEQAFTDAQKVVFVRLNVLYAPARCLSLSISVSLLHLCVVFSAGSAVSQYIVLVKTACALEPTPAAPATACTASLRCSLAFLCALSLTLKGAQTTGSSSESREIHKRLHHQVVTDPA